MTVSRRWYTGPLIFAAVAAALVCAACGSSSGGSPSNTGSTGTHRPAAVSSPKPGTTAQQAADSSSRDPLLRISKLCLVTMPQVATLSSTIFNLAPKPTDQPSTSGVDSCQYGGKTTAGGLLTKFLSITVLPNWSGMPNHFASQSGFSNASAGVVSLNGTALVTAGAQITYGEQHGQWLVLTVGNNGPPLVTWQALKATLTEAETQYNAANNATPASPPSASTGGNTSGSSSVSNDVACKLISASVISATFPPPDSNGLKAIEMGHGSLKSKVADATDYTCGYDFWTGNVVNQAGSPDGYVLVNLSCGPGAGQDATLTDDFSSSTFTSGGMTAAVGVTLGGGSAGTGSQTVQQVLANAATVAQRTNACR